MSAQIADKESRKSASHDAAVVGGRSRVLNWAWPLVVFCIGVVLSGWVYMAQRAKVQEALEAEFQFRADEVVTRIEQRIQSYEQLLRGGLGLFIAKGSVDRIGWRRYVEPLNVAEVFPGIQGFGYALLVPKEQLSSHTATVRAEGFPDYSVRPSGPRETYTSIIYLEPLDKRNLLAFGYDMYAEPVRQAAMERAARNGTIAVSGKVRLMQEGPDGTQAGFLMYQPVYRSGMATNTPERRRSALQGWVYAPFRMGDFMAGLLGEWYQDKGSALALRIYDGESVDADTLMYDSVADTQERAVIGRFNAQRTVSLDGHRWTLEMASRAAFDERVNDGDAVRMLVAGLVISALLTALTWLLAAGRARAERQARQLGSRYRESEERFRQVSDSAPIMIGSSDRSIGRLWLNRSWATFLGCAAELPLDQGLALARRHIHPEDLQRYVDLVDAARNEGRSYRLQYRSRDAQGDWHWLMETAAPRRQDDDGALLGYVICVIDITSYKEQEAALRARTDELSAIFMSVPDGVVVVDESGRVLKVNPRFSTMSGYSEAEICGQLIEILMPEAHRAHHRELVAGYMKHSSSRAMGGGRELKARRRDGVEFPAEISLSPVSIDGQPCVIAVLRDVSEQAQARRSLREAMHAAQAANRAKSEFLANMSHEIRTPLNGILGMAELVLLDELSPTHRSHLETLRTSALHLLDIVNEVLDISKIEAGQLHIEAVPFKLSTVIGDVMRPLMPQAAKKGIRLTCEIGSSVADHLVGDPLRLRQVLSNLLNNAMKFTARGGVELMVDGMDEYEPGRARVYFMVKDTGIGIPLARQRAIFEKFEQVDQSTTRRYGGTGLGLAICKQIVELMGGRITVSSREGVGSTFQFNLPVGLREVPPGEPSCRQAVTELLNPREVQSRLRRLPGAGGGTPLRVLLADDSLTNRMTIKAMLERHGHVVTEAEDGEQAVRLANSNEFDLILMDMQMPELDGLDATRQIRAAEKRGRHVPILALTANAMAEDKARCLEAGMDDYLTKPITIAHLLRAVEGRAEPRIEPPPAPPPALPDSGVVAQLMEQVGQDADLALGMIVTCLTDLEGRLQALAQAFDARQSLPLARAAHALKGLVALFGDSALRQLAAAVEAAARNGDMTQALSHAPELAAAGQAFREQLDMMRAVVEHLVQGASKEFDHGF